MTKKTAYILVFLLFATQLVHAQQSLIEQYKEKITRLVVKPDEAAETASVSAGIIDFAKSLLGVRYRYASGNPVNGFDCSGFVSYVFQNFGFKVPRSSVEFSRAGTPVTLADAKVGDVIIFTGTNPKIRKIGHVGIIYSKDGDDIKFIHSTSGKANGVTITDFDAYYRSRFIKVVSIL